MIPRSEEIPMGQVIDINVAKRASKARDVFPPIIAQETIDAQEADKKRRALVGKMGTYIRQALFWGVVWTITLASIGLTGAV